MSRWTDWSPDGHPTRWDLALALAVGVSSLVLLFPATDVRWPWLLAGFVVFGVAVGPAHSTAVAGRVGAWFRGIGVAGRTLTLVAVAAVVWVLPRLAPWTGAPLTAFGTGGLLGVAAVVAFESLR